MQLNTGNKFEWDMYIFQGNPNATSSVSFSDVRVTSEQMICSEAEGRTLLEKSRKLIHELIA